MLCWISAPGWREHRWFLPNWSALIIRTRPLHIMAWPSRWGGGEMKLLELAGAYLSLANGGVRMPTTPILWIEDQEGNVLVDFRNQPGEQVVAAEHAYQLTSILSDYNARCAVFACNPNTEPHNASELADRPVAAKTGSTNDTRDACAVGYTPYIAAGVWVGNNENSPMLDVLGSAGAAPSGRCLCSVPMKGSRHMISPNPRISLRRKCVRYPVLSHQHTAQRNTEFFSVAKLRPKADMDWWQLVEIDGNSGHLANEYCRSNLVNQMEFLRTVSLMWMARSG